MSSTTGPSSRGARASGILIACLASVALLGGCFSYRAGARDRGAGAELSTIAWPARDTACVESFHRATPAEVYLYEIDPGVPEAEVTADAREAASTPQKRVIYNRITDAGLLRVLEAKERDPDDPVAGLDIMLWGFVPNAFFLSEHRVRHAGFEERLARESDATSSPWAVSAELRGIRPIARPPLALEEGVAMSLPPVAGPPRRGLLLHFTALVGSKEELSLFDELERRGWAVVHIETQTTLQRPNDRAVREAKDRRDARRSELLDEWGIELVRTVQTPDGRTTNQYMDAKAYAAAFSKAHEQAAAEIPLPPNGLEPTGDTDAELDAAAARIAAAVDDTLAENAYAAEAAIRYIDEHRPDLAGLPVGVIGISAGALAAPAAAARLGDRISAIVLIGGGADLFDIAQSSTIADGGMDLAPDGEPPPRALLRRLNDRYLAHTRLDPYHTATHLRRVPALVVHAQFDRMVPSRSGELLIERLGYPDRLIYLGGHLGLFNALGGQLDRIERWLGEQLEGAG